MKFSTISALAIGLLPSSISATRWFRIQEEYHADAYCSDHVYYCGTSLLNKDPDTVSYAGSYMPEIKAALAEVGITNPTTAQIYDGLYYCRDNSKNGVGFERACGKCHNGGSQSDYCDSVGP